MKGQYIKSSKIKKMIISQKQLGFAPLIIILIVVVLIVAGGTGYYFYKTSQENKEATSQQDGLSFETAIVIEADNSDEGIAQEYEWLYAYGCSDKGGVKEREMQELQEYEGHKFDLLYAVCNNGEKEVYYFQIESFYGKW